MKKIITLFFLLLFVCCNIYKSAQETILIPKQGSIEEQLQLAKEVGSELWSSGKLHQAVLAQFPNLTEEDLKGLFIRWQIFKYKPIIGDKPATEDAQIIVGYQYKGNAPDAKKIALICKTLVEQEISNRKQK